MKCRNSATFSGFLDCIVHLALIDGLKVNHRASKAPSAKKKKSPTSSTNSAERHLKRGFFIWSSSWLLQQPRMFRHVIDGRHVTEGLQHYVRIPSINDGAVGFESCQQTRVDLLKRPGQTVISDPAAAAGATCNTTSCTRGLLTPDS